MLIFNLDESGISVVHKPGMVVAELGRRNVYAMTSAERGKTHTVLSCVSTFIRSTSHDGISPKKEST